MRRRFNSLTRLAFLLDDLRYDAGTNRAAAFADGKPQTLVHRDRREVDQRPPMLQSEADDH